VQTAVRLDLELITRLDAVARKLSRPGLEVTRTDALRICLLTGLQAIEKER
jgi:predicted DNA-binding protein